MDRQTFRQKVMHMSPPCISTGVLNKNQCLLLQVGAVPFQSTVEEPETTAQKVVSSPISSYPESQTNGHEALSRVSGRGVHAPLAIAGGSLQFISKRKQTVYSEF